MCWNAQVSLNTWLIGLFGSFIGFKEGYISFETFLFSMSFVNMQLVEYFLWSRSAQNELFSKVGLAVILSQPLFALYRNPSKRFLIPVYLVSVFTFLALQGKNINFKSVKAPNGHLQWLWNPINISILFMVLWFVFFFIGLSNGTTQMVFAGLVLAISAFTYFKDGTFSSMWCWFANAAALYFIVRSVLPCSAGP